jgi:hypothetical protein
LLLRSPRCETADCRRRYSLACAAAYRTWITRELPAAGSGSDTLNLCSARLHQRSRGL